MRVMDPSDVNEETFDRAGKVTIPLKVILNLIDDNNYYVGGKILTHVTDGGNLVAARIKKNGIVEFVINPEEL